MLILNKKRMGLIFLCFILSFSFLALKGDDKTVETVALPVENKVIVLDARTWSSR